MTLSEIAELSGISDPRNLGKWMQEKSKGGSRPTFNAIVKLLQKGSTVETLFGVEYANRVIEAYKKELESKLDPDFYEGLQKSIDAKVNNAMDKRVEYILKEKGLIK